MTHMPRSWRPIGKYAATCAQPPCSWFGTRGYLLTGRLGSADQASSYDDVRCVETSCC
jgi:hypothetical protein